MEIISDMSFSVCDGFRRVEYGLLKSVRHNENRKEYSNVYSILCLSYDRDEMIDKDFVYDISSDEETAISILNTLVSGEVLPVSLRDVLCDLLS